MVQTRAQIIYNKNIQGPYRCLAIKAARFKDAHPGQFLNVKVGDREPLLRRPFSIHQVSGKNLELLYEVRGQGTRILSRKKSGEYLDIIGPLGNGFDYRSGGYKVRRTPVLVAGGIGVAPLLFLAEKLTKVTKSQSHKVTSIVLIGAKTKGQILCEKEFQKLGCDVKIATDNGSRGFKGKVTDLFRCLLSTMNHEPLTIYACGPRPMLEEISIISKKYNIPAQISLEEHMACGIGACLGCVVKAKQGYQRVCKEGPVFNADEIIWG
jgi:dihydroorotate dehydrogenase electron transfer subunit